MTTNSLIDATVLSPLAWVGRMVLAGVAYLGGLATLLGAAARSIVRPDGDAPPFFPALLRQAASILAMGVPLVALVHVGIGSFLSMQAYFGGTFVDGTGAVVGVGLIRNVAPLMTGLTLAGLIAARTTSELRGRSRIGLDDDPTRIPDRGVVFGRQNDPRRAPDPARLAAVRIGATLLAAPALVLWAVLVGTVIGWQVAQSLMGVSTHAFFSMFWDMLWVRDILGLAVKAMGFALFAALFACYEGLTGPAEPDPTSVPTAVCRAACLSMIAILMLNSGWFLLVYHAGPAFGPTLLAPPAP